MTNATTTSPTASGVIENGPTNGKYHDMLPFVRRLHAASVFKQSAASFLQLPNFIPSVWPLGATLLHILILAAGIWTALFLGMLTNLSGNVAMAAAVPTVIFIVEFVIVPLVKFPACLTKSVAAMRSFVAHDRKAADAFHQQSTSWGWREGLVLAILLACLATKLVILQNFGTFQPSALLAANYIVAIADVAAHLCGVTSKVPYFVLGRLINAMHRRRRLTEGAHLATMYGKSALGALPLRLFEFESPIALREDEVDGHVLHAKCSGTYEVRSPGTLDDGDRAAFLHRQGNCLNQTTLARALATVQLNQLDAPEMRPGNTALPQRSPHASTKEGFAAATA